ncbi:MAG TPA: hypothetical protein VK928_08760 [Longimicrobiales bacterium]|nr:hypothetical protein [Longimicrobiales bacterium]
MRKLVLMAAVMACAACSEESTGVEPLAVFEVDVAGERFRLAVAEEAQLVRATELLESGAENNLNGSVRRGDGGFNTGYSWHVDPATVTFPDLTMEVCDGRPRSEVESDVDYWVNTVKYYCPWGAKIVARVR